eukprot:TRINITY_DN29677_c0_g1_i1.p4 TRINITY_DN29677_c0_g1~~TRINITY_DN29677_c0_g1_i1.p4  ORF type:complete len:119 (+),score=7.28 TRINITY_DN29677_c0_g1_i1:107-463(+)
MRQACTALALASAAKHKTPTCGLITVAKTQNRPKASARTEDALALDCNYDHCLRVQALEASTAQLSKPETTLRLKAGRSRQPDPDLQHDEACDEQEGTIQCVRRVEAPCLAHPRPLPV